MKKHITYLLLFFCVQLCAQIPDKPNPVKFYNNFSKEFPNFLSLSEAQKLEADLVNFSTETSNQICVVVVDDFGDYDASSYANEIGTKWGVGQKGFNNGIVILVKPTGNENQRYLHIAVGYGLEGVIPDLLNKRIREDNIEPCFKQGHYYSGLQIGVLALKKAAKGEYNVKIKSNNDSWIERHPLILFVLMIIIFIIIEHYSGKVGYACDNCLAGKVKKNCKKCKANKSRKVKEYRKIRSGKTYSRSGGNSWFNSWGSRGSFGGGDFGGGGSGDSW